MADPNYVYRPRSPEDRARLSIAHKARLGIPPDCVQIYGVHVPNELESPLRQYASWVNQKHGLEAAASFVRDAVERGKVQRPNQGRVRRCDRGFIYKPWPNTVKRRIRRLSKRIPPPECGAVLYGIIVPAERVAELRRHAKQAERYGNRESARWVICEAWEKRWPEMDAPKPARAIDWNLVDVLLAEHASLEEVAQFLGVTDAHFKHKLKKRKAAL